MEIGVVQTFSGKMINIFEFNSRDIDIEDVAHHLSLENRFAGATRHHYSVAQHSLLVSEVLYKKGKKSKNHNRWAMMGLLHDASEYVLKDIPSPCKLGMHFAYENDVISYAMVQDAIMCAFARKYCLPDSFEESAVVKQADAIVLATEFRDLMHHSTYTGEEKPMQNEIIQMPPNVARQHFLAAFNMYSSKL
jgi:5'-deoxynucleotidase YfbR-like HD superfamily hydrolase